jgi:hypothetical protein
VEAAVLGRGKYTLFRNATVEGSLQMHLGPMLRGVYPSELGMFACVVPVAEGRIRKAKRVARQSALEEYRKRG